ncbi:MAG: SPOR domain-containing protein, partial [Bacteroidota bacterium]|nr:SPOR domain-containing protein [Bacteroidota bacterium]
RFDLKGIGIFRLNEESKIIFEYVESENYLNDSFGLPELVSKPVLASEPVILRTLLKEPPAKSKKGFKNTIRRYYRAAATLMIGGVVVTGLYLLSVQTDYNLSSINPITLFQSNNQTDSIPEEVAEADNTLTNDNLVEGIPAEEPALDSFENATTTTDSDIIIASAPENKAPDEESFISDKKDEVEPLKTVVKKESVLKKVSIAPGEAVLISARVSSPKTTEAKTAPAKTPQKNTIKATNAEVKRNFTIDEINAALGKNAAKPKPESTSLVNSAGTSSKAPAKVTTTSAKVADSSLRSAKPNTSATINAKSERFYIIVNGYSTYESAEHNRKIIAKKGRPGKIIAPFGDGKLYRIAIAEYPSREQALQNLPALKTKYGNTIWILKR